MPPDADTPQVRKLCHRTHPQPEGGGTVTPVRRATYYFAVLPVSGPKTPGGNSHEHCANESATETRSGLPRTRPVFSRIGPYRSSQPRDCHLDRGISQKDAQRLKFQADHKRGFAPMQASVSPTQRTNYSSLPTHYYP